MSGTQEDQLGSAASSWFSAVTRYRLIAPLQHAWRAGLDLVLPPICLVCQAEFERGSLDKPICGDCLDALQPASEAACPTCGVFDPMLRHVGSRCVRCRDRKFQFDRVLAMGKYSDPLPKLIIAMKGDRHEIVTREIGDLFARHVASQVLNPAPDVVTAVPMPWWRKATRGTHVSARLAKLVSQRLGKKCAVDLLVCRRRMRKQALLLPAARRRNVRSGFSISGKLPLTGKHIMVVDDVVTTGATANEIARVLKRAGAATVTIAAVARGMGSNLELG